MATLGIIGEALIAGGVVAYRGRTRLAVRAFAAAAIVSGIAMWAVIAFVTPLSVNRVDGPPAPAPRIRLD